MNKNELIEILNFAKKYNLMQNTFVSVYNIYIDYRDLSDWEFKKKYPNFN